MDTEKQKEEGQNQFTHPDLDGNVFCNWCGRLESICFCNPQPQLSPESKNSEKREESRKEEEGLYRWVKASEKLPEESGNYCYRCFKDGSYDFGEMYIEPEEVDSYISLNGNPYWDEEGLKEIEWLEPLPKEPGEVSAEEILHKWIEKCQSENTKENFLPLDEIKKQVEYKYFVSAMKEYASQFKSNHPKEGEENI